MQCPSGHTNPDNSTFCNTCGARMSAAPSFSNFAPPPAAPQTPQYYVPQQSAGNGVAAGIGTLIVAGLLIWLLISVFDSGTSTSCTYETNSDYTSSTVDCN